MAESEARRRSREAKVAREPAPAATKKPVLKEPLQVTLLGHEIILSIVDLTIAEKQRVRGFEEDLGPDADVADVLAALAAIFLQRADPALTWEVVKSRVTTRMMMDAIAAGRTPEVDHPQ